MQVAVLGYGTVGVGVYTMLHDAKGLEPGPVLVRPGKVKERFQTSDLEAILSDEKVGAVAEVMGGIEPAFTYARKVLESGKHFVTSNKALCAAHGLELSALARQKGLGFLFSSACGGGMPFLYNLSLATRSDRVSSISGILNGTTNYMLDNMQRRDLEYQEALSDAQLLGYAEADPTADVSGLDALRKLMLGCAVAFGRLPSSGLLCEGIESFTAEDVADLRARGLVCRLIAGGAPAGNTVSACVEPVVFPRSAPEASVVMNFNMTRYVGDRCGPIVLMGQGAGRFPTASAVLRDLSALLSGEREMLPADCRAVEADNSRETRSYYVRCQAKDAGKLPLDKLLLNGITVRAITRPISPQQMHTLAKKIRNDGGSLFFAAMEED